MVGNRAVSIYRYVQVYACQAIFDTQFWRYGDIKSGLKALLKVGVEVSNLEMASFTGAWIESILKNKLTENHWTLCMLWKKTDQTINKIVKTSLIVYYFTVY